MRAVFTRHPPAGILVSRSYPMDSRVSGVAGMCRDMKSQEEYIWSIEEAGVTPSASMADESTNGSNAITSMPMALAFSATSLPTFP